MKAVIYRRSQGLVAEEVPAPQPDDETLLVRVVNTGFCGSDHSLIESGFLADGTILGHEASGTVAGWGKEVRGFTEGARIIVRPTFCGKCRDCRMGRPYLCQERRRTIGIGDLPGAFAEYIKIYPQMAIPIFRRFYHDEDSSSRRLPFFQGLHRVCVPLAVAPLLF